MTTTKLLITAAVGAAFSVGYAQAQEFTFPTDGTVLNTDYGPVLIGDATLSASITYTFQGIDAATDTATFDVDVTNTTATDQPGDNRLVGFAIDVIEPTLSDATINGTSIYTALIDTNFPGGFGTVDFCAISGSGNNCSGGAGGGLGEGETVSFDLVLTFASDITDTTEITFGEPYLVRFQSIGSQGLSAVIPGDGGGPPVLIPEPSTLALLGLGLLGAGLSRRRWS